MTDEAPNPLLDADQRQYLLAAAKHRSRLAQSDTEDLFSIARRLRTQFEAKKAADAKKPAPPDTDRFGGNRPGWRLPGEDETNSWEHDRRKKAATKHVREPEPSDMPEEALSDARAAAYQDALTHTQNDWRTPSIIEDERRKKRWQERDPQGREAGSGEEEIETDADCNAEYEARQRDAWKTLK